MTPRQLERTFRRNTVYARRQFKKLKGKRLHSGLIVDSFFIRAAAVMTGFNCMRLARECNAHVTFRFEVKGGEDDD